MSKTNRSNEEIFALILTVLGVAFVIALVSDLLKDVKKNTSSDVISDEGKEILEDEQKREKLRAAVDHYHKEGNWDLLHKVAE